MSKKYKLLGFFYGYELFVRNNSNIEILTKELKKILDTRE